MKRKPRRGADPFERDIELALNPGAFIPDRACYSFVSELEEVAAMIAKLIRPDPVRAATLYETFLAGCYEKAEELHDSSGSFGQFVGDLICKWIKARQASGTDPDETAARLLARMDDDPYALCYDIEKDAAKAFDKTGLAAFERQIRTRFELRPRSSLRRAKRWDTNPSIFAGVGVRSCARSTSRRRTSRLHRPHHSDRAHRQGLHALAALLVTRRKPEEALVWAERGISLDRQNPHGCTMAGYELIGCTASC